MSSSLTVVPVSLLLATSLLLFWLWLVILPARVAMLCPEGCKCDTGGYFVHCFLPSLKAVPLIHLTNVRVLRLSYNEITFLEKDSFFALTELEELDIYKCGLRTIDLGAFNGLTKLKELNISYNDIREILPGTFENMNSLENLDLNSNRLEYLDSDVFSGLVNLKEINLEHNKLQYLQLDTFLVLPNLQQLYLGYNPTLTIPTNRNLIHSNSLSELDIANCNVSSVLVETFANVSALEALGLSYNNLRTVDINILRALPKLSSLYLYGNPLQCDCQLQEVWRWCEDRNIQREKWREVPECDTPQEVNGMWWGGVRERAVLRG
jgi:Leucine-rich repeat (LRR) protein